MHDLQFAGRYHSVFSGRLISLHNEHTIFEDYHVLYVHFSRHKNKCVVTEAVFVNTSIYFLSETTHRVSIQFSIKYTVEAGG
jgi:hypothetical protein